MLGLAGAPVLVGLTFIAFTGYHAERWSFLDPLKDAGNTNYQLTGALSSVASGGWFGVGPGASTAKWGYLPEAHTDAVFAVCDAAQPDELLGLLGLHGVEVGLDPGGRAEIGYWMRPEGRGRGLMSRAAVLATSWAVHELDLAMLSWYAVVGNEASRRVAEKAGYTVEGTLRRGAKHRGVLVDTWVGSILREDLAR